MLSEDGSLVWAAEYTTWGSVRRLWQADNDTGPLGNFQGDDPDGNPVYSTRVYGTDGNAALKSAENPDEYACPIRFQGQWADEETGLYYNRHRYYDPGVAQYLSPDPIGLSGGLRTHGYVEAPTGWIDPFGLAGKKCCCGGRAGKQARLKELANDPKVSRRNRGWIKQEMNSIARKSKEFNRKGDKLVPRRSIRNSPNMEMAHERGREAAKGYSYKHSHLQDSDLHDTQHKYDDYGRNNKERSLDDDEDC